MTLTPRSTDFSARYNELVEQAWLAQHSAVRGCMVIKPYGYAIRENMQHILDQMFKATGIGDKKHTNAYFPLFIPKSFFTKEAKHVEWFATEAAIVTHYRLKKDEKTGEMVVDPEAKLDEELIVRPTSETIIWNTYKDRIQSYRDLPILVNQRANVVRWEMRTRLFLRTAEFLRQEWHTAHATAEEAMYEAKQMRDVYNDFFTNVLAMSWVMGEKSENERFAGAENTYTIECMMQDGKALQSCTSHYLGQNFGKAFDVQFLTRENTKEYAYATSRGISTRALGGMIMSHSDDKGLVLPPAIAPIHVVIVPFFKTEEDLHAIVSYIENTINVLQCRCLCLNTKTLWFWSNKFFKFRQNNSDSSESEKSIHDITLIKEIINHKYVKNHSIEKDKDTSLPVYVCEIYPEYYHEFLDYMNPIALQFHDTTYFITSNSLQESKWFARDIEIKVDKDSEKSPWRKFNQYELEGVPIRLTVGKKEMEQWVIELYRRDTGEKQLIKIEECVDKVMTTLYDIQNNLFAKNNTFREDNTVIVNTRDEFIQALDEEKFVLAHRDGTVETEKLIKEETKATIRCIPDTVESDKSQAETGMCIKTGKPSQQRVLFARSY